MDRERNLAAFLEGNHPDVPHVVYHSSKADVRSFDPKHKTELSNMGYHFGTAEQANFRTDQYDFESKMPNVGKYHLSLKNPLEVSHMASFTPDHLADQMMDMNLLDPDHYDSLSTKHDYDDRKISAELVKILKKNGYDGLKYQNEREGEGYSFVPFDPTQIKSATGNNGNFDPNDPDITKAEGGSISKDTAIHKGRKFWSGVFDSHDGFIREVHPYKRAEAVDFHHSHYVSPQSQDAMKHGDAGFFWVDPDGSVNTHWRDDEAPKHIVDAIKSQIEPINKENGGGITAYHGSPHDFEQFDTSKIGTGEGNQAYGHGLYFAEHENVAKGYRNALSSGTGTQGHMYEVHIDAHPDHFIDYNKGLGDQHPFVKERMRNALAKKYNSKQVADETVNSDADFKDIIDNFDDMEPHEISKMFHDEGIQGIKYLDQRSRTLNPKDPTHNYVVFDPNRVNIKRKYEDGGRIGYGFGGDAVGAGSGPVRGGSGTVAASRAEAPAAVESRQDTRGYRDMPPDLLQAHLDLNARGREATEAMQRANESRMPFGFIGRGAPSAYDIANQEHMPAWAIGLAPAMTTFGDQSIVPGGVFGGGAKQPAPAPHYEPTLLQNQIPAATPPLPTSRPAPMPTPRPTQNVPMPTPRPADLQPSFIDNLGSAVQDILSIPQKVVSGIGDAFTQPQQQQTMQQPQDRGGGRRRLVKKLMPDGSYQDVWEEYADGGVAKYRSYHHNPAIIEHALSKVAAPPPAFNQTLMVAKRGRPL